MSSNSNVNTALKLASEEHSIRVARFNALKAQVLDRSLPLELRLRAYMLIDAEIWRRRQVTADYMGAPDKIVLSKQRSEVVRLERVRAERAAQGLPTRTRRLIGTMCLAEPSDAFTAPPPGVCHNCGRRFDPERRTSIYCSPYCRRAVYNARRRMVNGGGDLQRELAVRYSGPAVT